MNDIQWKPEYIINNAVIDKEHKHLFEIALEAFKPVLPEKRKNKIRSTIIDLNEYMKLHFEHEESFMRLIDYPKLHEHQIIHQSIIQNMKNMLKSLPTLPIKEFEKNLAFFIDTALVNHILQEDKKIQEFYKGKENKQHKIDWKSDYLLGNEQIDTEHKTLFEIANKAFSLLGDSEQKQELKKTILSLSSYVREHFEHEEKYMQSVNYPSFEEHRAIHQKITDEINNFIKKMPTIDTQTFELELAIFIDKWLVQHIIYEDAKIKEFIQNDHLVITEL